MICWVSDSHEATRILDSVDLNGAISLRVGSYSDRARSRGTRSWGSIKDSCSGE